PLRCCFTVSCYGRHPELPSFPARRSSDLGVLVWVVAGDVRVDGVIRVLPFADNLPACLFQQLGGGGGGASGGVVGEWEYSDNSVDRKSTRLNSSHVKNSYAVFCLKNKINE